MEPLLYLIPNTLGGDDMREIIPAGIFGKIKNIRHYVVESERSARRFLARAALDTPIDQLIFHVLDEHSRRGDVEQLIPMIREQGKVGVLSDAGLPGIADPGSELVRLAHRHHIRVIPLTGPGSIFLALMASGLNGQNFAFNGYLPVKRAERVKKIKVLEARSKSEHQSQLFMETPYRNMHMVEDLLQCLQPETALCIAADLTLPTEFIHTQTVREWKEQPPDVNKRPAIFIVQAS